MSDKWKVSLATDNWLLTTLNRPFTGHRPQLTVYHLPITANFVLLHHAYNNSSGHIRIVPFFTDHGAMGHAMVAAPLHHPHAGTHESGWRPE